MKYEIITSDCIKIKKDSVSKTLYRIRAIQDFGDIKAGDFGGWIEKYDNLSQDGNCWVYDTSWVYDNAKVCGDARVFGNATVCDNAMVAEKAQVVSAVIEDRAQIRDNSIVHGVNNGILITSQAIISDNAYICAYNGDLVIKATISKNASVVGNGIIEEGSCITDDVSITGKFYIGNNCFVWQDVHLEGDFYLRNDVRLINDGISISGDFTISNLEK